MGTEQQSIHSRSSRDRFQGFVRDYKKGHLDDSGDEDAKQRGAAARENGSISTRDPRRGRRREYLRAYLRWLQPHRYAVGGLFILALAAAGLEMIEPLFLRHIIDRILLNSQLNSVT